MSEVADRYARIADRLTALVDGCPATGWTRPSPCPEWTAHQLLRHVVDTHRRVLTRLAGGDPTPPDSHEDLPAAWRVESDAIAAVLADPARAATEVAGMGGTQPFEDVVGTLLCADTLIHSWDLARATGQDERLDPDAVRAALAFLEPNDAMLRVPNGFGARLPVAEDADDQTRLLAFTGRQP